jgi:hypothetical protein
MEEAIDLALGHARSQSAPDGGVTGLGDLDRPAQALDLVGVLAAAHPVENGREIHDRTPQGGGRARADELDLGGSRTGPRGRCAGWRRSRGASWRG